MCRNWATTCYPVPMVVTPGLQHAFLYSLGGTSSWALSTLMENIFMFSTPVCTQCILPHTCWLYSASIFLISFPIHSLTHPVHHLKCTFTQVSYSTWRHQMCSIPILECIEFTSQRTISEMSADKVQHPVCGLVPRVGWAALKKGVEVSFSVFRKVSLP